MNRFVRPALLHRNSRCEVCAKVTDCTYNVRLDKWMCSKCALDVPLELRDYAWSSLSSQG